MVGDLCNSKYVLSYTRLNSWNASKGKYEIRINSEHFAWISFLSARDHLHGLRSKYDETNTSKMTIYSNCDWFWVEFPLHYTLSMSDISIIICAFDQIFIVDVQFLEGLQVPNLRENYLCCDIGAYSMQTSYQLTILWGARCCLTTINNTYLILLRCNMFNIILMFVVVIGVYVCTWLHPWQCVCTA